MRNLTASQTSSFNNETITIATLVDIYVNDGTVVSLTDHDQDLAQYRSSFGLDTSAIVLDLAGTGQTATLTVLPDKGVGGGLTYDMIEGGLLDNAMVKCYWVDYSKAIDPIQLFLGYCYCAKYGNSALLELSVSSKLSVGAGLCQDIMQSTCRADFGDAKCKIDVSVMVDGPHVYAPIDAQSFMMTRDEVTPLGYYNNGTIYFQTGANKGLGYEILTVGAANAQGRETIYSKVPFAFDIAHLDYFFLYPGCDKQINSGCTYWNNTANFQGEPFVADPSNILPPVSALTVKSSGINTGLPAPVNWWLTQYIKIGYGKAILFTAGTRAADGVKSITAGGYTTHYFSDTIVASATYTAIFNLLGSLDTVAAFDGSLTPKDPAAVAALAAAGFQPKLNLDLAEVLILDPENVSSVEAAYLAQFYVSGTAGYTAAATAIGYVAPDPSNTSGNAIGGG